MEKKKQEKIMRTNLYNISNNTYQFLKEKQEDDRVIIEKDFDFDSYKESVRQNLNEFSCNIVSLYNINSVETKYLACKKAKIKNYVDEILDDDSLLENFTIYKIQQFINRVAKNLLESSSKNFVSVSKTDKYIKYREINIDMSNYIGFVTADNVISYLYREFDLKRVKSQDYEEAFKLKYMPEVREDENYLNKVNEQLFKAAIDMDERGHIVINHPFKEDKDVMNALKDGFVAERSPKRIHKVKKLVDEDEEDFLF